MTAPAPQASIAADPATLRRFGKTNYTFTETAHLSGRYNLDGCPGFFPDGSKCPQCGQTREYLEQQWGPQPDLDSIPTD